MLWVPAYVMIGDQVAPGGQLFSLVTLTVAANFGGWLISLTTLPRLIGMLFTGILMQVRILIVPKVLYFIFVTSPFFIVLECWSCTN